jgi:hypothetical protein
MYITPDVDLPDQLLEELQSGRLVVFAGAGVSIGSPSNLPDFTQFARQIAEAAIGAPTPEEPLDQYLGRAENRGVRVQVRARQLLDVASSKPTQLHESIVRVFGAPDKVRIVTTNFDRHFESVIIARHGARAVSLYTAPALPLGRDARGLVHVHGGLDVTAHPLVLTDADFGRAYLTEGWATRLLVELFIHNTVCFIGYSHGDPTMRYLARSLVPGTARFALTPPGADARWSELGIVPVHYPLDSSGSHAALTAAIDAWADMATMGALEHEHRIRALLTLAPPLGRNDVDYLRRALADRVQRPLFLRSAGGLEWLTFVADAGVLDPLFDDAVTSESSAAEEYANWLADRFMLNDSAGLLDFLAARGFRLSRQLWHALAWMLARAEPLPKPELFIRWVSVLVSARNQRWNIQPLSHLLGRCTSETLDAAVLLFGQLLTPVSRVNRSFPTEAPTCEAPPFDISIRPQGDDYDIARGWQQLLQPALDQCHQAVGTLLTDCLSRAHLLLVTAGVANDMWDPASFRRTAIEPHAQDRHPDGLDAVIDAARDLLEYLRVNEPEVADAWIALWRSAKAPLLKRIAIHGLAEAAAERPAEALQNVLTFGWLHVSALKHETFRLLERAYSQADEPTRTAFLEAALKLPVLQKAETEKEKRIQEYERFNLLVWLSRAAEDSQSTADRLRAMEEVHRDFAPREHPDLSSWSSGVLAVVPIPPRSVEELLAVSPATQLDWLRTYQGSQLPGDGPDREGLLIAVRDASKASFEWSWELAEALRDSDVAEDDELWASVLKAWQESPLDAAQWVRVFDLIEAQRELERACPGQLSGLLEHAAKEDSNAPVEQLGSIGRIAERLACRAEILDTVSSSSEPDWLFLAINHPAGRAAMAWLQALSALRDQAGGAWAGLPGIERERLERILAGTSVGAARARTVFASQTHFLHAIDPNWAQAQLLPLFDWAADEDRAACAWDGYLQWGQWNEALFVKLGPYLGSTFRHMASALEGRQVDLARFLVGVALYSSADPWHGGWLNEFVREADADSRAAWAVRLGRELRQLTSDAVSLVWHRWLGDYWRDRLTGVPSPLDNDERQELLEWLFGLRVVLPDAVELLEATPVTLPTQSMFLERLREDGLATAEPQLLARLLRHVLQGTVERCDACGQLEQLVGELIDASADRETLIAICEALARLGCAGAAALRGRVP